MASAGEIVHGKMSTVHHDGKGVFAGLPEPLEGIRYHSLAIVPESVPPDLEVTARTDSGVILGGAHRPPPGHRNATSPTVRRRTSLPLPAEPERQDTDSAAPAFRNHGRAGFGVASTSAPNNRQPVARPPRQPRFTKGFFGGRPTGRTRCRCSGHHFMLCSLHVV